MKKLFIIANWKSYKTEHEAQKWLEEMEKELLTMPYSEDKEVIVCPPFTLLPFVSAFVKEKKLSLKIGAQDISQFGEGRYTGAINGKQLAEFVTYVIIGHSERRTYFGETDEIVAQKVAQSALFSMTPILCVQDAKTAIPEGVNIVAYEPVFAIGTGIADTPENASETAFALKKDNPSGLILYGGSVTSENVRQFTAQPSIHGVLVGGASLDAQEFCAIIHHA